MWLNQFLNSDATEFQCYGKWKEKCLVRLWNRVVEEILLVCTKTLRSDMPLCRDPFVSLLNSFGFNALRIPRRDYLPGSILIRSRDSTISLFGNMADGFMLPKKHTLRIAEALAGEQFEGATSANYRVRVASKLLCDWLGVAPSNLASSFSGAKRISYQIQQTKLLSTSFSDVIRLLSDTEPTDSLLSVENARLYIISDVLQAKEILLLAQNDAASSTSLDTSSFLQATSGNPNFQLETAGAAAGMIKFIFAEHHTIGFKVYELEIAGGEYRLLATGKNSDISHLAATKKEYSPIIFEGEPLF